MPLHRSSARFLTTPRRHPATPGERKGTLIRHAALCSALPICTLAIAMVVSSFRTLLVSTISEASLLPTGLLSTHRAAVVLPPVTVAADPEDPATATGTTNSLTENNLASDRHPRPKARLDNGHRSWQVKTITEDGYLMKVAIGIPAGYTTGVPTFPPAATKLHQDDDD